MFRLFKLSTTQRISLTLSLLAVSLILVAHFVGLIPDEEKSRQEALRSQRSLCETIALQCCVAAERNDHATMQAVANLVVARNNAVDAILVRRANGQVLARAIQQVEGAAVTQPADVLEEGSQSQVLTVPIFANQKPWGEVQVRFPLHESSFITALGGPLTVLTSFVGLGTFLLFSFYLRRVLTHLDPSAVVPDRVKATLDTLAEGVVVLDNQNRVVLANEAFATAVGRPVQSLFGERVSDLKWCSSEVVAAEQLPWERAFRDRIARRGEILRIDIGDQATRTFSVNASPILGTHDDCRGVLATFDDLTQLEEKNATLLDLVEQLQESQRQIEARNEELQYLAMRDSLTGCFNRRAFFSQAETAWEEAKTSDRPLVVIMADIDHFKQFNDQHGHAVGDKVLQHVARILQAAVRKQDLVCRFGGEEFCVLVRQASLNVAHELAERIRTTLTSSPCGGLKVNGSFGVAAMSPETPLLNDAIEQADRCLYASKRLGRNRVTTWQQLVARGETELRPERDSQRTKSRELQSPVSLKAVNTLFNSLMHRDRGTGEHSRRVANLCVVVGQTFLPERDLYILEAAALLHDVGKLGVPDAVLLKPGPLTADEWKVMSQHDDISRDLVDIVFSCPEMSEIVATHHSFYGGNPREPNLPAGEHIPLGARILSICDAYDAIVSDRAYHRGRSHEEAIAELLRCAGSQFDPSLVERFISTLETHLSIHGPLKTSVAPASQREQPVAVSHDQQEAAVLTLATEIVELVQAGSVPHAEVAKSRRLGPDTLRAPVRSQ